ncbi:MAG: hypothetical protein IT359_04630 [Gemmatimonadaceae bacterium]|nr:hypothetical protein [Gemmatimonadaceae bacterium]
MSRHCFLPEKLFGGRRAPRGSGARVVMAALAIASLGALPAASLQAQRSERPFALAVGGGIALPTGEFGDTHGQGTQGTASLLVRLAGQRMRFRPEVSYARFRLERTGAGNVDPLAVSPLEARAKGRSAGAAVVARDVATEPRHTALVTALANVELPLARGSYLIGGVGLSRVRTTDATTGDALNANALAYGGGLGWRTRLGRVEGFVEARLQRFSIEAGRAYFSDAQLAPLTIGVVF